MIALSTSLYSPDFGACSKRLQCGREQCHVRSGVAVDTAAELLNGPIHHRLLLHIRRSDADQVTTVLELGLHGFSRNSSRATSSQRRSSVLTVSEASG